MGGRSRAPRRAAVALAVMAFSGAAAPVADAGTRYRGQWQCNDRGTVQPLAGAHVELWQRGWDWLPVPLSGRVVARGVTADNGGFDLEAPNDADRYFVRVILRDNDGVHLKDWYSPWDWFDDSPMARNDVPVRDLGQLQLGDAGGRSPRCAIWRGVHDAVIDYRTTVGERPPYPDLLIRADAPSAGVPYALHTAINWAPGHPASATGTAHEFAHTVRHGFDGDAAHFFLDVARFDYLQHHHACLLTNPGFAFNEGWADYWSRSVTSSPGCPNVSATDFRVEGNVAAALADLERRCAHGNRRVMIDVLRRNRGTIHSFPEFAERLPCPAPAPVVPSVPQPPAPAPSEQIVVPDSARRLAASVQVNAMSRRISTLGDAIADADRPVKALPVCVVVPCAEALEARTALPALRGEIEMARLLKRTLAVGASTGELHRVKGLGIQKAERELASRRRAFVRSTIGLTLKTARAVLKAARPVLRGRNGSRARRFAVAMARRIVQLRNALKTGSVPPSLAWAPSELQTSPEPTTDR